jgi:hypothetical protein
MTFKFILSSMKSPSFFLKSCSKADHFPPMLHDGDSDGTRALERKKPPGIRRSFDGKCHLQNIIIVI